MKKSQLSLLSCLIIIFVLGLVMIFDTSSAEVLDLHLTKHTWHDLIKQMCYALIGALGAFGAYKLGIQKVLSLSPYLLILFSFLLVLTFVPGIGRAINGSHRWISIMGVSIQPSEFVKYLIPAYFIYSLNQNDILLRNYLMTLGKIAIPLILVLIEPNNGTVAVMTLSLVVLSFVAKIPFKWWGIPLIIAVLSGATFLATLPYAKGRLNSWLHPELDLKGKGHQPYQAKIAAGSGKVFGKGPGKSLQKLSYLPEAQNDYIAAIFAEEYGFLGIFSLITLYMFFTFTGFLIVWQIAERDSFLMCGSIVFLIAFQAFLNLGVVSGLLPSTGLNLPFFSQGGTSLIANATFIGFLLRE
ncbi:putative lipid II flippase FtsW [Chlamydiales bacterium]|nr:putative lipid II flippase FtsW [Chlamydiales bacterium]